MISWRWYGNDQSSDEFRFISHQLLQREGLRRSLVCGRIGTRIRKAKLAAASMSEAAIVQAASLFFWQLRNLRRRSRATSGASWGYGTGLAPASIAECGDYHSVCCNQPIIFLSHTKPASAISHQPPTSQQYFSLIYNKSAQRTKCI